MRSKGPIVRIIIFASILILSIIIPAIIQDPYWTDIFIFILIFIILSTSLRLVINTGQATFAHPALAAIGGYCSGALTVILGFSFWEALPIAGLAAALISLIIGYPTLRIKGVYFFLITFTFTSLVGVLVGNFWIPIFGGWKGLINIPRPNPIIIPGLLMIKFTTDLSYYYLVLFLTVMTIWVLYRVEKSRFGWVFRAIENADLLAESVGINLMKYKLLAFVIAGIFAGIAGCLFAHYQKIITPYDFDLNFGILLFIYTVVGGTSTIVGPILGVIFLRILAHPLRQFGIYETMILGFILILFLRFIPGGLIGLLERIVGFLEIKLHDPKTGGFI